MQHLFIQQCNALIETMLFCKREQRTRELIMDDWVEENQCGFAACVLGHHATMSDITPFVNAEKKTFGGLAVDFSNQLTESCYFAIGYKGLAHSIFLGTSRNRFDYAARTGFFTDGELETLNHLNKEPSYDDVIEYLELVIHKTEQFLEQSA